MSAQGMSGTPDLAAVEQFLYHEARLLDRRLWAQWLDLFTPDGMYWIPLVHGQTDPLDHASIAYEDAMLRQMRARRLDNARAFSQQPLARTSHLIGNVIIDAVEGDRLQVSSSLHMMEWRHHGMRMVGGACRYDLRATAQGLRIALKRIDLIDCEAPQDPLEVFI